MANWSAKKGFGRWMKAVGLAAGLALPAAAHAESRVAPGLLIGFASGSETSFTLGLDVVGYPTLGQSTGFGAFGRIQTYDFAALRFAGGVLGTAYGDAYSAAGELGWAYLTSREQAGAVQGIHLGAEGDMFLIGLNLYGTLPLVGDEDAGELGVAFVIRPNGLVGPPSTGVVMEGRPLRAEGGRLVPAIARAPRRGEEIRIGEGARARLAEKWLEAARSEHASVPAFVRLARELRAAGAPEALVRAAIQAAGEEVGHAREAFALAARYAGEDFVPCGLPSAARPSSSRASALERLAIESLVDGGLGEGGAAAEADAALDERLDEPVREALAKVAIEEARHAELGWRVLEWAVDEGGAGVRDAALREIDGREPTGTIDDPADADPRELARHGLPSGAARARARERTWESWRERARRTLG